MTGRRVYGRPVYVPHEAKNLTAAVTLTAATETTILAGPVIDANWYEAGRMWEFYLSGSATIATAARTLTINLNLNGTTGNKPVILAFASGTTVATAAFTCWGWVTCRSIATPSATTFIGSATATLIGATLPVQATVPTATVTLDTTADSTPTITASWDATTNNPTITFTQAYLGLRMMK